jgi:exopolyphosphatase/guanosine-5'-triphosphate,3'-diphosphate pyrophosphatase
MPLIPIVAKQLSCVDWLPDSAENICLIGGTVRAIARLHKELYGRQHELQGYNFEAMDIKRMLNTLLKLENEGAKLLISVAPDRIHTIIPGLIGFSQIIKLSRCKTLTVSRSGVREGFIKELFRKNS